MPTRYTIFIIYLWTFVPICTKLGKSKLTCYQTRSYGVEKVADCNVCVKQICFAIHFQCSMVCPIENNIQACTNTDRCEGFGVGQCRLPESYATKAPTYCCYDKDLCNGGISFRNDLKPAWSGILLSVFHQSLQTLQKL